MAVGNHEIVVAYISRELSLLHSSCEVVLPLLVLPAVTNSIVYNIVSFVYKISKLLLLIDIRKLPYNGQYRMLLNMAIFLLPKS